jgi:hypothetical protein
MLPKLYYYHNGSIKKTNQKDLIKMVKFKMTYPKWHFGQVGHGGQKTIWGVFFTEIPYQKGCDFLYCK